MVAYLETRSAPRRRLERYVARERPTDFSPAASHLFHTLASPFLIYPGHVFHAAVRPHTFTCGNFCGGLSVQVRFAKSGCHQDRPVRTRTRAAHATLPGRPHARAHRTQTASSGRPGERAPRSASQERRPGAGCPPVPGTGDWGRAPYPLRSSPRHHQVRVSHRRAVVGRWGGLRRAHHMEDCS